MFLKNTGRFQSSIHSFGPGLYDKPQNSSLNMTPVIDIVFLLIIFFLVVCQFIEAENFPVDVPDDCNFAQGQDQHQGGAATVSIMKTVKGKYVFAVGSEKITVPGYAGIVERVAELIEIRLKDQPIDQRVVTLRIDKDVCFGQAQFALAGIAASTAGDIRLATIKNKRPDAQ